MSDEFVRELAADADAKGVGPIMAFSLPLSAAAGVLLTLGLVMRWGEIHPRWLPYLGGRRVPVALAVLPATVVSIAATVAGLAIWRWSVPGGVTGTGAPGLLWPVWGLALGIATLAYYQRRRSVCLGQSPGGSARSSILSLSGGTASPDCPGLP